MPSSFLAMPITIHTYKRMFNKEDVTNMSELNLLKKMAREANVPHFDITKGKIEGLSKIVETEVPLGPAEWDELVKRGDPLVYCAILADQRAPSDIKIAAIHGVRKLIDSNKKVFLPMLFDKDKNIFDLLTRKASFEDRKHTV